MIVYVAFSGLAGLTPVVEVFHDEVKANSYAFNYKTTKGVTLIVSKRELEMTSLEAFIAARESGATIAEAVARIEHDDKQLDALPPAPRPIFLVLVLDGHRLGIEKQKDGGEFVAACSCGYAWTHKAEESTRTMEAVFTSHVAYFTKKKTEAL